MSDPYSTLGLSRSATADDIRRAYRTLAKSLHPDTRPDDRGAEERFKRVTQAFKLLSDPAKRAKYDRGEIDDEGNERPVFNHRRRPGAAPGGKFEDIGDIFTDLFTDFQPRAGRGMRRRGADVRYSLELDFLDAARGTTKRVTMPNGRALDIKSPPGVADGQVLRLAGQGEPGSGGARAGDALVEIRVKPHKRFSRAGDEIRLDLPVTLKEAVLGAKVRAPTIDGPVDVKVPPGSTSGTLLRLRGRGLPGPGGKRGDQIIRLVVDLPASDSSLRAFAETWTPPSGYDPRKGLEE